MHSSCLPNSTQQVACPLALPPRKPACRGSVPTQVRSEVACLAQSRRERHGAAGMPAHDGHHPSDKAGGLRIQRQGQPSLSRPPPQGPTGRKACAQAAAQGDQAGPGAEVCRFLLTRQAKPASNLCHDQGGTPRAAGSERRTSRPLGTGVDQGFTTHSSRKVNSSPLFSSTKYNPLVKG